MSRSAAVAFLSIGLALGCAAAAGFRAPPAPEQPQVLAPAPAQVHVEVSGGLAEAAVWPAAEQPVEIVIDASLSMASPVSRGVTRYDAARQLAARYLAALPAETPATLRVLGITTGGECGPAVPIDPPADTEAVTGLATLVATLPPPRGESSLATALRDVARGMSRAGVGAARVVVLSDLEPACDGDLCAAAQALVDAGAELEIVGLGDVAPAACLAPLASFTAPRLIEQQPRRVAPEFRVGALAADTALEIDPQLVAWGRANGEPSPVPAGRLVVTVDLDPPMTVGPLDVLPGEIVRVRVLDFPVLDPPAREVWVEGGRRLDDETDLEPEERSPAAPEKSDA